MLPAIAIEATCSANPVTPDDSDEMIFEKGERYKNAAPSESSRKTKVEARSESSSRW